jgi:MFS family permease
LIYYFAWEARSIELFFVGAALLGCASPLNPHGIAYVSDISVPKRAAQNIGVLQGFGYFAGLMTGALIARLIASVTIDNAVENEEPSIALYNELFLNSFFGGFGLSIAFVVIFIFFLPESLHLDERSDVQWKLANPLGIIPVITRNGYMFFIWLMCFFSWISIGGGEAVTGGWWLRRYAISDSGVYISFLVVLWVLAGFGAVIMTKLFTMKGLKLGVHLSSIGAISAAVALSLAPDVGTSYIAAGVGFFGSAAMPIYLVIFMGQAAPNEKGLFSGTYRTSEALAKIIGIQVMGNLFAEEIKEFQPDFDCIGATPADDTCACGAESCPQMVDGVPRRVPKFCTLGQLSTVWSAKPGLTPTPVGFNPRPELIDGEKNPLFEQCRSPGGIAGGGLVAEQNKLWCAATPTVGCFAPIDGLCVLQCLSAGTLVAGTSQTSCIKAADLSTCEIVPINGPFGIADLATRQNISAKFLSEDIGTYLAEVLTPFQNETTEARDHHCPSQGEWEVNLCWEGTITDFPGFTPFILSIFLMLGYASFIIAEVFFIDGDARHWVKDEDIKDVEVGGVVAETPEVKEGSL